MMHRSDPNPSTSRPREDDDGSAAGPSKKQKLSSLMDGAPNHQQQQQQHHEQGDEEESDGGATAVSPIADDEEEEKNPSQNAKISDEAAAAVPHVPPPPPPPPTCDQSLILGILSKIKSSPKRVDVAESGFAFMKRVVRGNKEEDLIKYIMDAGGISLTASIMKNHPNEEGLQTEGRALLDLLFKAAKDKMKEEGIKAILTVMETLPGDVKLQTKCCDILDKAADNGLYDFIGESRGISLIVAALRTHPKEEALLNKGLGALVVLTYSSDPNCTRVADAGGITAVVETLERHYRNPKMQSGIDVLVNLSCDSKERARAIIQAGGHVQVVAFMKSHSADAKVQEDGCWALANLAYFDLDGVRNQLVEAGAIPAVVNGMKLHPKVVEVQQDACRALHHLSKGGVTIREEIVKAGGLEVLGTAIRVHPANKNMVSRAKEAWNSVTQSM